MSNATDIHTGSIYLKAIDDAFEEIINGESVDANLELIRRNINREFNASCVRISLINNDSSHFFGAYVINTKEVLYKEAKKISKIEGKFRFETEQPFVIELDSKLVYDLDAEPQELTAVLLHEIGHKIFSKDIMLLSRMLHSTVSVVSIAGAILAPTMISTLLTIPMSMAFHTMATLIVDAHEEVKADSLAVKYGYGVHIHNIIMKMMDNGEVRKLFKSKQDVIHEQQVIAKWTGKNIREFNKRKRKIVSMIKRELRTTKSPYLKELYADQLRELEKKPVGIIRSKEPLNESLKSIIEVKKYGVSELELDEIRVEMELIEIPEDKIYLIERIHKNISRAKEALRIKQETPNSNKRLFSNTSYLASEEEINQFINDLRNLAVEVRNKKIKESQYGIYAKYHAGDYERNLTGIGVE